MTKLFTTGFLQVFFVAINTWLITQQNYVGVFIVSFVISFIWCMNVRKINVSNIKERIVYSMGAATGGLIGLVIGRLIS
jgi:hypothetical protein